MEKEFINYNEALKEQNQILKDINDVNDKLIAAYKERLVLQEQIIIILKRKEEMYSLKEKLCK